jgi:hypothetical protein
MLKGKKTFGGLNECLLPLLNSVRLFNHCKKIQWPVRKEFYD